MRLSLAAFAAALLTAGTAHASSFLTIEAPTATDSPSIVYIAPIEPKKTVAAVIPSATTGELNLPDLDPLKTMAKGAEGPRFEQISPSIIAVITPLPPVSGEMVAAVIPSATAGELHLPDLDPLKTMAKGAEGPRFEEISPSIIAVITPLPPVSGEIVAGIKPAKSPIESIPMMIRGGIVDEPYNAFHPAVSLGSDAFRDAAPKSPIQVAAERREMLGRSKGPSAPAPVPAQPTAPQAAPPPMAKPE